MLHEVIVAIGAAQFLATRTTDVNGKEDGDQNGAEAEGALARASRSERKEKERQTARDFSLPWWRR
jgi:hypothetical protein